MLKIAICDDEQVFLNEMEMILNNYLNKIFVKHTIEIFYDGKTLKKAYEEGERFDILYLDIEMSIMNGIEVAKYIRKVDRNIILIYVSSYESYFIQLFEVEPFRFIKKPIHENEVENIMQQAYERVIEKEAYFTYKYNRIMGKIPLREIKYFESAGRIVYIHKLNDTVKYYGKLDDVEQNLKNSKIPFLRIHKSYYVNFHYINEITFSKVIISDIELQISKKRQAYIRKMYLRILREEKHEV